jgi:hypothetical protein
MDNDIFIAPYQGYTLAQLKVSVDAGSGSAKMVAEIARREAVEAGDMSVSTPGERLSRLRSNA